MEIRNQQTQIFNSANSHYHQHNFPSNHSMKNQMTALKAVLFKFAAYLHFSVLVMVLFILHRKMVYSTKAYT